MAQLRQEYQLFVDRDVEIVVVGPEKSGAFRKYWEKENLPFIGVADPAHEVLNLFGQQVKIFKLGRMPAQCLVDKQGMVRYVHYGNSMADIPSNEAVLALIKQL